MGKFPRSFAEKPPQGKAGAVLDGRDVGTVLLPDATLKLFITASDEVCGCPAEIHAVFKKPNEHVAKCEFETGQYFGTASADPTCVPSFWRSELRDGWMS